MAGNKIRIPREFNLLGYTFTIEDDPELLPGLDCRGLCRHNLSKISIAPPDQITETEREHTYLHELTHAILRTMGREDLNDDEAFVDLFSGLLHQALTSAKYEL